MSAYDVVTLGETMIRLSPPQPTRLEQANSLEVNVGGAESNVALALARLGRRSAWLSRLPDNPWGHRITSTLRAQGVDVSSVVWAPGERVGTYFVEYGQHPRPIQVWYDRADSAMSRMTVDDVPWAVIDKARIIHCTGITPALSASCAEVVEAVMRRGQDCGAIVSFDLNYRALLWTPEEAARALEPYCKLADWVLGAARDVETLFGVSEPPQVAAPALRARWGCDVVVLTRGDAGAVGCDGQDTVAVPAFEVDIVDRLGAGDAFDAGFIASRLTGEPLAANLRYGAALAALTMTIPSDLALVRPNEVEALLKEAPADIQR